MAPEVLLGTGRSPALDWWSFGVILYELLVGFPPFNDDSPEKIFDNIINRTIIWPDVPEDMSPEAQDLIDKLLTLDPDERLGSKGGAKEIEEHPFFKGLNMKDIENAMCEVPFKPEIKDETDTSYFDEKRQVETKIADVDAFKSEDEKSKNGEGNNDDDVKNKSGGNKNKSVVIDDTFGDWTYKNIEGLEDLNKSKLHQSQRSDK